MIRLKKLFVKQNVTWKLKCRFSKICKRILNTPHITFINSHQENHRPADKKTKCEAKLSVLQKEKINNETLSSPEESVAEAWWNEAIYGGNTSDEKEWQPPKRKKRQRKNDVSECSDTERLKKNRVGNGGK